MKLDTINTSKFNEVLQNSGKAVVTFSADWCAPCKMLTPTLEKLASQNPDVTIAKIIVDDNRELSEKMGVRSIPTTLFFKEGNLATRTIGNQSINYLQKMINEL